jgi:hypothetical protein
MQKVHVFFVHQKSIMTMFSHEFIFYYLYVHLNKVLQKFSTAQPSSSVAKHKLPRDTKKQQDNVITSNRAIMTS